MQISPSKHVGLVEHDSKLFFRVFDPNDLKAFDHIPGIYYKFGYSTNPMSGAVTWFLNKDMRVADLPKKIYGRVSNITEKVLSAFNRREVPTGVLLHGEKGNGKTIQIYDICNRLVVADIPVITVDQTVPPVILREAVSLLSQCCPILAIIFDEFEKYYPETNDQNELLSMFSDRNLNRVLTLMVVNDYKALSEYYKDRPSRLLFSISYDSIDLDVAKNIIKDNVFNPQIAKLITNHVINEMPNYDQIFEIINNTIHCESAEAFIDEVVDLNVKVFTRNMMFVKEVIKVVEDSEGNKAVQDVSNYVDFSVSDDYKTLTIKFDNSSDVIHLHESIGFIDAELDNIRKTHLRIKDTVYETNGNLYFVEIDGITAINVRNAKEEIIKRCKDKCHKPIGKATGTVNNVNGFGRNELKALMAPKSKPAEPEIEAID